MPSDSFSNTKKSQDAAIHFGHIAPKFASLTDKILFDDIWQRTEQLTQRERSLITIASLITQSRPDQLLYHLKKAHQNKISQNELVEVVTHLAFYAGWPSAAAAISQLEVLFAQLKLEETEPNPKK